MKRLTDEEILQEYKLRKAEMEGKLKIINDNISLFTGVPIEAVVKSDSPLKNKKLTWGDWFDDCLKKKSCTISEMVVMIKPHKPDLSDQTIKDCLVQTAYNACKNHPETYIYENIATKGRLYRYSLKK